MPGAAFDDVAVTITTERARIQRASSKPSPRSRPRSDATGRSALEPRSGTGGGVKDGRGASWLALECPTASSRLLERRQTVRKAVTGTGAPADGESTSSPAPRMPRNRPWRRPERPDGLEATALPGACRHACQPSPARRMSFVVHPWRLGRRGRSAATGVPVTTATPPGAPRGECDRCGGLVRAEPARVGRRSSTARRRCRQAPAQGAPKPKAESDEPGNGSPEAPFHPPEPESVLLVTRPYLPELADVLAPPMPAALEVVEVESAPVRVRQERGHIGSMIAAKAPIFDEHRTREARHARSSGGSRGSSRR